MDDLSDLSSDAAIELLRAIFTKKRITLLVEVDLDPGTGWGNVAEDYRVLTQKLLTDSINHYNPVVTVKSCRHE